MCSLLVQLNEVIDRKNRQRDPNRRRSSGADLENGQTDNPDGEDNLQINAVVGRALDFVVEHFDEIDDRACRMRMLRKKFGFRLDAVCQFIEFGIGAVHEAIGTTMHGIVRIVVFAERSVELVVLIGVIVQHDAARCRIDNDVFNSGNDGKNVFYRDCSVEKSHEGPVSL